MGDGAGRPHFGLNGLHDVSTTVDTIGLSYQLELQAVLGSYVPVTGMVSFCKVDLCVRFPPGLW